MLAEGSRPPGPAARTRGRGAGPGGVTSLGLGASIGNVDGGWKGRAGEGNGMRARSLCWLAIAVATAAGPADECTLTVLIRDAASGDPVPDVSVEIAGGRRIAAPTD